MTARRPLVRAAMPESTAGAAPARARAALASGVVTAALAAGFAAGFAGLGAARAQAPDLTVPPRIDEPGGARLAERRDEGPELLEEVIVVGDLGWRLPDLGGTWRENEEAEREPQRIDVAFLPLYDPENRDPYRDLFPRHGEIERVGFIELFRVRFGSRPAR